MGDTLGPLRHKRVIELNVSAILANAGNPGELEARLVGLLNEAVRAGNIILYIDDLERLLIGELGKAGSVNAGEMLVPYLESSSFQLIGTITTQDYHRAIERQNVLSSLFEKIEINEPDDGQSLIILQDVVPAIENKNNVYTTYPALKEIIAQAHRYLSDKKFPEIGIDLLDEIAVEVSSKQKKSKNCSIWRILSTRELSTKNRRLKRYQAPCVGQELGWHRIKNQSGHFCS